MVARGKTKRLLETIQLVLTFASTCAVADTLRIELPHHDRPGYYAAGTSPYSERGGDRRLADLARADRKRREAEQQSSRRGIAREQALEQRQLRA
jgi:hypothetical protein